MNPRTIEDALARAEEPRGKNILALDSLVPILAAELVLLADEVRRLQLESNKYARACAAAVERLNASDAEVKRLKVNLEQADRDRLIAEDEIQHGE